MAAARPPLRSLPDRGLAPPTAPTPRALRVGDAGSPGDLAGSYHLGCQGVGCVAGAACVGAGSGASVTPAGAGASAEVGVGSGLGGGAAPGGVGAAPGGGTPPGGAGAALGAGTGSAAFASSGCNTSGRAAGIGVGV